TLPADLLALAPGHAWSGLLTEDGRCHVVAAACGRGYREFKTRDGYDEPVIGVVVVPCGTPAAPREDTVPALPRVAGGIEVATFLVGNRLLGVPAAEVLDCIEVADAVRVWRGGFAQRHVGFVTWQDRALPLVDIAADVAADPGAPQRHAIVLRAGLHWFGLLVSELGPVTAMTVPEERAPAGGPGPLISRLGRAGTVMLPVLSPEAIHRVATG
ncbi:MAG TPA: chemotaxis protein CheW, partial [Burkholderiaceae bacterium]